MRPIEPLSSDAFVPVFLVREALMAAIERMHAPKYWREREKLNSKGTIKRRRGTKSPKLGREELGAPEGLLPCIAPGVDAHALAAACRLRPKSLTED